MVGPGMCRLRMGRRPLGGEPAVDEEESRYIACIAHDRMKDAMVRFISQHRATLGRFPLIATGSTGEMIHQHAGLPVTLMKPGPLGGDQQIGSEIASGRVRAVIFLRDPSAERQAG